MEGTKDSALQTSKHLYRGVADRNRAQTYIAAFQLPTPKNRTLDIRELCKLSFSPKRREATGQGNEFFSSVGRNVYTQILRMGQLLTRPVGRM